MELGIGAHTRWKIKYHCVWGTRYRHLILVDAVSHYLLQIVKEICLKYDYTFDTLGTDGDHVHLLVGNIPSEAPEVVIRVIKSISGREIFKKFPSVRNLLWGSKLWASGYYIATVGEEKSEKVIRDYVKNQGTEEDKALVNQMRLFR